MPGLIESPADVAALDLTILGTFDDGQLVGMLGYQRIADVVDVDRLRSVRRIFGGALDAACSKRYAGKNPPRSVSRFLPEQRTQRPSRSTPEPDTDWFKKRRWPASTSSTSNTPHEHNPGRAQSRNREPWTRLVPDWYSSKARCSENSGWLTLQLGLAHPPTRPGRGSIPSKVPELEGERRGVGG